MDIKNYMPVIYIIFNIYLYNSQTWALRKTEEMRLKTFAKKILRQIGGPNCDS